MAAERAFGNFFRSLAKRILETYNWYIAEIQFGECIVKYAYTQHPEQMQLLRMENISKMGQTAYTAFWEHVAWLLSGRYYDAFVEHERIAAKVEQLTLPLSPPSQQKQPANAQMIALGLAMSGERRKREKPLRKQRSTDSIAVGNVTNSSNATAQLVADASDKMEHRAVDEENAWLYFENHRKEFHEDVYQQYIKDQLESQSAGLAMEERMNLNEIKTVQTVDDLFNWEPIILEGLGIDPQRVRKYSPGFCAKNYIFALIKRAVTDYIRSAPQ